MKSILRDGWSFENSDPVGDQSKEVKGKGGVGQSIVKIDAVPKVCGERIYPQDFDLEGQLHARMVWSQNPHAEVLSINTARAEAYPGVVRVLTAEDVPENSYGINYPDQSVFVAVGDKVRSVADRIAMVIAETPQAAKEACTLVEVQYKPLPVLSDPREAMKDEAILVHPERGDSNVIDRIQIKRGDIQRGFEEADVVVESFYTTQAQEHAYMQPDAGVGYLDDSGRVTVIVATQTPHDDIRHIARILKLEEKDVHIIVPAVGGAFGGREDMQTHHLLAVAAFVLRRPVKLIFSREETTMFTGHRHPFYMRYKTGATREGLLTAMEVEMVADAGAYISSSIWMLNNATSNAAGPYKIPNAKVNTCAVYTNNVMNMAMRGFGAPQAAFAYEMQMNKLADALGMDPVEFRLKNILEDGDICLTGKPMPQGVGLKQTLTQVALAAGWRQEKDHWVAPRFPQPASPEKKIGLGLACGYKNVGFSFGMDDYSKAVVELNLSESGEMDSAVVSCGASDLGMGTQTALVQIAAEVLNLNANRISVPILDTAQVPYAGSSSASRQTYTSGNAVYGACREALKKWEQVLRDETGETKIVAEYEFHTDVLRPTSYYEPETGECDPHISYGYTSQAVLLEVDLETGATGILKLWTAQDCGKMIDPAMVDGQVAGAVHMGVGFGLMEEFIQQDGIPRTRGFSQYLFPTVLDMPEEMVSINIEIPDPTGPFGAKGVGEMPLLPTAPAIMAAIHGAAGVWMDALPATAERVWTCLNGTG